VRRSASEKMEIIRLVEQTDLPVKATLRQLGVPRSTFYDWYQRYEAEGFAGLHDARPAPRPRWNKIPEEIRQRVQQVQSLEGADPLARLAGEKVAEQFAFDVFRDQEADPGIVKQGRFLGVILNQDRAMAELV